MEIPVKTPNGSFVDRAREETKVLPDGTRIIEYRDPLGGVTRHTETPGGVDIWEYPHGEKITGLPGGIEIREDSLSRKTTSPGGLEITEFSDGRKFTKLPDGTQIFEHKGKRITHYPDGSSVMENPDGSTAVDAPTVTGKIERWIKHHIL